MPHKQPNLERQLSTAQQQLDARQQELDGKGVATDERPKDPAWRQLNARRLKLKSRLRSAAAVVDLTEEVIRRKAEKPPKEKAAKGKKSGKKAEKAQKSADKQKPDKKQPDKKKSDGKKKKK